MLAKFSLPLLFSLLLALALTACGGGGAPEDNAQDVTVVALDTFQFEPAAFDANVGQTVNVTLDNQGVLEHNFVIDEFDISLGPIAGGQTTSGSFTPDQEGTFEYFCDVPGHREAGMVGTLTVGP